MILQREECRQDRNFTTKNFEKRKKNNDKNEMKHKPYENVLHIFSPNNFYARYLHTSCLPVISSTKTNSSVQLQRCVNDTGNESLPPGNTQF